MTCVKDVEGCYECNEDMQTCKACKVGFTFNGFTSKCVSTPGNVCVVPKDYPAYFFNGTVCRECEFNVSCA